MSCRTHRSSGYGYERLTELPEIPGIVARRTEGTEVPGTGMNVLQNLHKFQVRVIPG